MSFKVQSTISWDSPDKSCEKDVILVYQGCESITLNGVDLLEILFLKAKIPDTQSTASKAPYTIGRTLVDPLKHSVSFNDQQKHLSPMAFMTLDYLYRCDNFRAAKDDIVRKIWNVNETCMAMYCLNNCVYQLRKVLTEESGITIDSEVRGYLQLIEHT